MEEARGRDNQFLSWPLTGREDNCSLTQGGAVVSIVRNTVIYWVWRKDPGACVYFESYIDDSDVLSTCRTSTQHTTLN